MAKVLFEGTKTFWKTKNSLSITIVEHCSHDVLEVVAYEPKINVEAPRLYIDMEYIVSFLDAKLEVLAKDETALANSLAAFVFNRVYITQFLPISKALNIAIHGGFGDKEQGIDHHVTIPRPLDLIPYSVARTLLPLRNASLHEKWRIPLILVRLIKGLPLRGSDKEIYERFAKGKSKPELVETVARALRTKITIANDAVLKEVAHSIVLEPQSPFPAPKFRAPNPHSLPPGFADSVKAAEASRFSSRSTSPGQSGYSTPSPRSSGSSSRVRALRDLFRLPGASKSANSSCPSSVATSTSSTPAASRPPSPGRSRRSSLVQASSLPGVAYAPKPIRNSTSAPILSSLLAGFEGYHSRSSANANDKALAQKPPLGLACPTSSMSMDKEDGDGLLGVSIHQPGQPGVGYVKSKPTQRLAALRGRRRTFDTETECAMSPTHRAILQASYPTTDVGAGAISTKERVGVAAGGHHVRAASGGTLSALLGFASAMGGHHRVAPANAWTED